MVNDEIQHVEAWAPFYHEPLIHLPAAFVPRIHNAIVLGGGSFFAATELLKYRSLRKLVMVDHDPELLSLIARVYSHAATAVADRRLIVHSADIHRAREFADCEFDLVVNDAVDLTAKQHEPAFAMMSELAGDEGVCCDVIYRHLFARRWRQAGLRSLNHSRTYALSLVAVPEYPGVLHLLTMWSKSSRVSQRMRVSRNMEHAMWSSHRKANPCKYFDPRFLPYYLYLPPYLREMTATFRERRDGSSVRRKGN